MKSVTVVFVVAVLASVVFMSLPFNVDAVSAQNSSYSIQRVDHQIEVMYSGHVIIRDTIHVTGQLNDVFLVGFPRIYGAHVLNGIAYDANGILPMSLNVPFEGRMDLYGASISFSQESPLKTKSFTVVFTLSNDLVHQNNTLNAAAVEFPAYPTLAKEAASCNVTLVLPDFASSITLIKNDGTLSTTHFNKENLAAFTSSPANVTFAIPNGILQLFSVRTLSRVFRLNPAGDVVVSDSYRIVNNGNDSLVAFSAEIPLDALNIIGKDEFGRNLAVEAVGNSTVFNFNYLNVTFPAPLAKDDHTQFVVEYNMPRVSSEHSTNFAIDFDLLTYFDYYITDASIMIVLPEGAAFLTCDSTSSLSRDGFQEKLTITKHGVSHIELELPLETTQITYSYNPLWASFLPTLWAWMIATVGCIVVAFWRRSKNSAPSKIAARTSKPSIGLGPGKIQAFTNAYEEKSRIASELKHLDIRAQKSRISRRRYKVQRRKLAARLESLSKDIAELKTVFRDAGGNHGGLVRQLDTAEAELAEVEADTISAEDRHRRGVISLEECRKLLVDYQRRREKAETAINGILLRIREETR